MLPLGARSHETIISLESLHFKKSIPLIGSRKPLGEARSFYRIDNYVLARNLRNKYSCSYLNRPRWAKPVRNIFSWSASPYRFSRLFIVDCSVVFGATCLQFDSLLCELC